MLRKVVFWVFFNRMLPVGYCQQRFQFGFEDPTATLCSDFNNLSWRASSSFSTPPIHLKGKIAFPGCLPEVWCVMDFCIREVLAWHFPGWPLAVGRACSRSFTGYSCSSRGGSGTAAKAWGTAPPASGLEWEFYSSLKLHGPNSLSLVDAKWEKAGKVQDKEIQHCRHWKAL